MTTLVGVATDDAIAVLTLNAPSKRNALSTQMLNELNERLAELSADAGCRAIVLTGSGEHFCAGGDLSMMTRERPILGSRQRIEAAHRVIRALTGGPKPVIAAVEGFAFGAGLSLAAACDTIVCSTSAKFAAVFTKVGLIPDMGSLWTIPQRIGLSEAKRLFISGRTVSADEALSMSLVDKVVEQGTSLAEAVALAKQFSQSAPLAVAYMKSYYAKGSGTLDDALRTEMDVQPAMYLSDDHIEAVAAFMEKRPAPVFRGQ